MANIENTRSLYLANANPRLLTTPNAAVLLSSSAPVFHVNTSGVSNISSILFTAYPIALDATAVYSFSCVGGTLTSVSGKTATLLYTDMVAETATVTVSVAYRGSVFVVSTKVTKLFDADTSGVDLSAANLKSILENQITESQLYLDLRNRINLVDGAPTLPGSVSAKVKAETDARVAALTQEASNRTTYVQGYTYSKAETDSSLSIQANTITAAYTAYADAARVNAISTASADVRSYSYSKANTDSAIAATANTLRSEFSNNNGVSVAYLENYAYSKAGTDSAISSATSTLSTTVGQHTTTLQTQATSLNGLSAQYTVKIDNNGYVTGYGLASTSVNGSPTSSFIVNADKFAVVAPGVAPNVMFSVGTVNGQTVVGFTGKLIGPSGTLGSLHILDGGGIHGGDFTTYAWPASASAKGFYLGPQGLMLGTTASGRYFNVDQFGDVYSPGFTVLGGAATFSGALNAASGSFKGAVMGGSYTSYNWPSSGGGFYLGPEGFKCGTLASGKYFNADQYGDVYAPNFTIINGQPSFNAPVIISPRVSTPVYDAFSLSSVGGGSVAGPNGALSNSVTLTITGNNGPHKVVWNLTRLVGGIPSTVVFMDASGVTASVSATASNTTINVQVSAVVTGADGRTLNFSDVMSLTFGSA